MPNHFLLTGNELVADWPTPSAEYFVWSSQNVESWNEKVIAYENRPRYACTKELMEMLKQGERYEEGVHFRLQGTWVRNTDRNVPTKDDFDYVAEPVEKREEIKLKLIPNNKKASHLNSLITEVCRLRLENNILKQKLSNIKNIIG